MAPSNPKTLTSLGVSPKLEETRMVEDKVERGVENLNLMVQDLGEERFIFTHVRYSFSDFIFSLRAGREKT